MRTSYSLLKETREGRATKVCVSIHPKAYIARCAPCLATRRGWEVSRRQHSKNKVSKQGKHT
jgi:hypothetical protein